MIARQLGINKTVLDVGCGDLTVAKHIMSRKNVCITGLDTVEYNRTNLSHYKYDGKIKILADSARNKGLEF